MRLERRRPRATVVRGAAADAEGPADRAAARVAPRAGGLPAPDRARSSARSCARRSCARASRRSARSSSRSTRRRSSSARPRGIPTRATAAPRRGARRRASSRRSTADELERAADRGRARPPGARSSTTRSSRPRPGLDETHVSLHEGLLPGPGADRAPALPRPREPAPAGARGREPRSPATEIVLRGKGRRPGDERACTGRRARATSASRFPTTPSSASAAQRGTATLTVPSRARSSGDRALPCGGRGRKFESCRAHPRKPAPPQRLQRGRVVGGANVVP